MLAPSRVAVLGLWHLGSVYSACLADCGYLVVGWDKNDRTVRDLNNGVAPLFEPGLDNLVSSSLSDGKLSYTSNLAQALSGSEYVFLTFDTPVDEHDNIDLSEIFMTIEEASKFFEQDSIIIVSSQVPVGTCEQIAGAIAKANPSLIFDVACSPENLRLGQAVQNFKNADRIVIGANNQATMDRVKVLFNVVDAPKISMNLRTAEMTKHALNAFLATSISFANEIANICDEVDADALRVSDGLRSDTRIGSKAFLSPGLGFAGGTLARDTKVLAALSSNVGYEAPLINGVLKVNEKRNSTVVGKLERICGTLHGKLIGILGLTYKPNTSTLRRSAAIEIIEQLVGEGAAVRSYDPMASTEEIAHHKEFEFCTSPYETARDSDALVFITQWPEFKEIDFDRIKASMRVPVIVDTQNMLNPEILLGKGFEYYGTGRGSSR